MRKKLLYLSLFLPILFGLSNASTLTIERSRAHEDKSGKYTPLVVSLSTEDITEKAKPVDLICIVDVSGSMSGTPIELVKNSLEYLVNISNSTDNLAMVTFSSNSKVIHNLTQMTEENKSIFLKDISTLWASGGTNILSGLEKGLDLLTHDYSSGERIASMVLLSDGDDNYYDGIELAEMFRDLIKEQNKSDYIFTLHSFGYGEYYDYIMLKEISLIKDGSYFHINQLPDVNLAYIKIYGYLSTVKDVNVQLKIESKYDIVSVYGIEDMYDANITNGTTSSSFKVTLIQVGYGRKYEYVLLVDVPENTPKGTEVLNATVSKLGLEAKYLWDGKYSLPAYEEYIRCIVVIIFIEGYEKSYSGISVIEEGIEWIKNNYNGTRNWVKELNEAKTDLNTGGRSGNANLLSKITELKTSKVGIHYDEGNSYQRTLIDNFHGLDISKMEKMEIKGMKIINYTENINYYYFYLKQGNGLINNLTFSGESSSLILYSNDTSGNINITSLSDSMDLYLLNKSVDRIQTIVDFNHVGKFIFKKDFPFDFYTKVDGKRDITFNIELLNYNTSNNSNNTELLDINAYILTDNDIDYLLENENTLNTFEVFKGTFDYKINMGKLVIKQKNISDNLNTVYNNYLYIIIKKNSENDIITSDNIKGQFYFIPNNYIYSSIPENYKIYSNLEEGEDQPHLYTLEIDSLSKNNVFLIEIDNFGNNELDFKILNYQNYIDGIIDYYNDYNGFVIEKENDTNKIYLNVTKNITDISFNKIILSIFSTNKEHKSSTNLSYIFNYTTDYREIQTDLPTTEMINETTTETKETIKTTETKETTEISTIISVVVVKVKVIILGFAKFSYVTSNKIINFFMYFIYMETTVYAKKITINANIKYKNSLRLLQEDATQKGECILEEDSSDNNQKRYNCNIETNGKEIDNIQLDKNIEAGDDNIDFSSTEISPIGMKFMNNIQNVGNEDPFSGKQLYTLNSSSVSVDNDKNEFNITGNINNDTFNYDKINLEISLTDNSEEITKNISCIPTKIDTKIYNLQCNTKNEMHGTLNNAFANLEDGNLFVEINDNKNISFQEKIIKIRNNKKSSGGLSTGGIIAIIIPSIALLFATIGVIIYFMRKRNIETGTQNNSSIVPNTKSSYVNQGINNIK